MNPRQSSPLDVSLSNNTLADGHADTCAVPIPSSQACSNNHGPPPAPLIRTGHHRPTFVELCAGSARLAHIMRAHHFQTYAIDHPGNQHKELHACLHMDLSDPAQQTVCREFLQSVGSLAALHMGLPCATCSRARERALPRHLRGKFHRPMPLRNTHFPLGLPTLRGASAARVASANGLYRFALSLLPDLVAAGVQVTIENPRRSWLWPVLKALARDMAPDVQTALQQLQPVHYDGCMHGGKRLKRSTLLASPGTFQDMGLQCHGQHEHLPWSITPEDGKLRFDTASEAEYPPEFCHHYAQCVIASLPSPPVPQAKPCPFAIGPRKKAHSPLIPEFRAIVQLPYAPPDTGQYRILSSCAGEINQERNAVKAGADQDRYKVGIRWDPLEFMHQAKKVTHPCDPTIILPPCLKAAIAKVLTSGPEDLAKSRLEAVKTIRQMAGDLAKAEADLKKSLDPTVAKILKDKNLCLWKALLTASDYDDIDIVDSVASGINLVGSHGKVEAMDEDLRPAEITPEDLLSSAPLRRKLLKHQVKQHSASEQEDLNNTSKTEVELGDLQGPFSEQQVTKFFGSEEWLLNPRFPIYQGDSMKVRVIDDCKMSGMNTAFQRTFGVKPMDIDVLAAAAATIAKSIQDGQVGGARVHEEAKSVWLGGTLDLSRAYKQVPLSPQSRKFCVLGFVINGKWVYYRSDVLPFGASASVFAFIRISRSIHHILSKYLSAICTVFFDDFPTLTPEPGSDILKSAISTVLSLLGWAHAKEGKKALNFSKQFIALGAEVDLEFLSQGSFKIKNKEGRVPKLNDFLSQVEARGFFKPGEISVLQGHLNFATGFYLSKGLRFLTKALTSVARCPGNNSQVAAFCQMARHLLAVTPDRQFNVSDQRRPMLIFSDGAYEQGKATAGAVVFDSYTSQTWVCKIPVPESLQKLWLAEAGKQIISQVEAWALLVVRFCFRHSLKSRQTVAWIDNEAARLSFVKGTSDSPTLRALARIFHLLETTYPAMIWLERVSSFSNPGDAPSRNRTHQAANDFQATTCSCNDQSWLVEAVLKLGASQFAVLEVP